MIRIFEQIKFLICVFSSFLLHLAVYIMLWWLEVNHFFKKHKAQVHLTFKNQRSEIEIELQTAEWFRILI